MLAQLSTPLYNVGAHYRFRVQYPGANKRKNKKGPAQKKRSKHNNAIQMIECC
jgi:hypothetical protein